MISQAKLESNTIGSKLSLESIGGKVHSPDSSALTMKKKTYDYGDISKLQTSHHVRNLSEMSKSVNELKNVINSKNRTAVGISGIASTQVGTTIDLSKTMSGAGVKFSRDMITPEIAAYVVKEYLLPMFESDGKRLLSKKNMEKRKRSKGPSADAGGTEDEDNSQILIGATNVDGTQQQEFQQLMDKDYAQVAISGTQQLGGKPGATVNLMQNKTVFSELKLSEILLADIEEFRDEVRRRDKYEEEQTNLIHQLQKEYNDA